MVVCDTGETLSGELRVVRELTQPVANKNGEVEADRAMVTYGFAELMVGNDATKLA